MEFQHDIDLKTSPKKATQTLLKHGDNLVIESGVVVVVVAHCKGDVLYSEKGDDLEQIREFATTW